MRGDPRIVVLGSGSIGTYVGGAWLDAGLDVTLIGRERIAAEIAHHGLTLSDFTGWTRHFGPEDACFTTNPAALADADLILLTVKSGGTADAAHEIAAIARPGTMVVSLQNGIGNIDALRKVLGDRWPVIWGMVPYNVVNLGDGRFHKGAAGMLMVEHVPAMAALADRLKASREPLRLMANMVEVAWGKLVINLNNAVNALSGRTLVEQLGQRDYRRVVAASQAEALRVLKRAGIAPARVGPVPPHLLPAVIASPNWLFLKLFMRGWKIDSKARSSMADDIALGRKTEVDQLNGEVVRLAEAHGMDAPINRKVVDLVRKAEAGTPPWAPLDLRREVLGR